MAESKGIVWADVDNDGDQDLFVAFRFASNKLWLNDGNMNMVDVSATCGIAQDDRRSFGPAWEILIAMGCWIYLLRIMVMRWMSHRAMNYTATLAMVYLRT